MTHHLQQELASLMHRWQETYREDAARLRLYQRELANARRLPARPRASITLLLRQCAAARRMKTHAKQRISGCQFRIKTLSA
ncbi:hypothetical protein [Aeromonas hydrophila]|uniref:hypothetical protein n=1 Tax=Aeromonas hydrophila TaxID=644 RepID=UPI0009B7F719|nr:hypothetical protein [Aeromonas hydrophila]HAT1543976.1 hypothetical protein [Aeromonas hydrophila]HAT1554981.1 hypothetical protein [Aeromonas hydrophila]